MGSHWPLPGQADVLTSASPLSPLPGVCVSGYDWVPHVVSLRGYLIRFCLGYVVSVFAQCWPGPNLDVGRVCTSVQCSVQPYRAQYRVVCSTAAIADWDARRSGTVRSEAVYKAASLRLSANSEPSVSTKIAAVRRDSETGRETQNSDQ